MITINSTDSDPHQSAPLALHSRRLRQFVGERGISSEDLADLSGVPSRTVRLYEAARELPYPLEAAYRLARSLDVPMEYLLDPCRRVRIAAEVQERRLRLRERPSSRVPDAPLLLAEPPLWYLSVCLRSEYLALVVFGDGEVREVVHRRVARRGRAAKLSAIIAALACDYAITTIVAEPESPLEPVVATLATDPHIVTVAEAKDILLPGHSKPTHATLYVRLVANYAKLRRFIGLAHVKEAVSVSEPWRTVILLAVALGLAAQHRLARAAPAQSDS